MSKSADRTDLADALQTQTIRRESPDDRHLLDRILETPRLESIVPKLQPDLLHRVIQSCGLEDCGELVALATPEQLSRVFDLDLWRATGPGMDERFDAERFGVWIEVLLQAGASVAAQKLAGIDVGLVVAGLAQHALVYDRIAVTPYETLDGEQVAAMCDVGSDLTADVGGCLLVARRADSWEAIVEVLRSLDAEHPDYFGQVIQGCRTLSNADFEIDGLHDILADSEQVLFDLAVDRERRREKQGYAAPAQARAFLQMSRQMHFNGDIVPSANPLARAYFREIDKTTEENSNNEIRLLEAGSNETNASVDDAKAVAAVYEMLLDAGVIAQPPRALLGGAEEQPKRLGQMQAQMQFVLDHDLTSYSTRSEELVYLANTLLAGCSIQTRPFTIQESLDAAVAVCNLGLENWPTHWLPVGTMDVPANFLVDHDLVTVFQIGWMVLHRDVCLYAAEQLIGILARMQCNDQEIQFELDTLRFEMKKHWRDGAPWRARDALDVIASLDLLAWSVLLALIDECPMLHAGIGASTDSRVLSVNPSDFEFISENREIAAVRTFMQALPEMLKS